MKWSSVKCWTLLPKTLPYLDPEENVFMPTAMALDYVGLSLEEWRQCPRG